MVRTIVVGVALLVGGLAAGCALPTPAPVPTAAPTPPPTSAPVPTALPTPRPPLPTPQPTAAPPTPAPFASPTPSTPTAGIALHTDQAGRWQVRYPAHLLRPERLNESVVAFYTQDRSAFVAVESYMEVGRNYGNTGENMRNRARDTMALLAGDQMRMTDIFDRPAPPWRTGLAFAGGGATGEALYTQPLQVQPTFRVYGVLFAYRMEAEATLRPLLVAVRDSFTQLP